MSGKKVGYIRVSSFEQNPERQLDGIRLDKQFIDKASGKDTERPQLQAMLDYVREDDTVIVHSMDRLARNLDDLRRLVSHLTSKKVKVEFIKESLTFTNEDSPMSKLLLSVMGAVAEFERALIKERQLEGIELAKKRGAYRGRKPTLSDEQLKEIKQRLAENDKKSAIARDFNISRETLYQYLKKDTPHCHTEP
jgi:DNA invertase Pin-like site-specific DNA recombinase